MRCLILLVSISLASARIINKNDCGVIVNGLGHDKVVLKEYVDKPYQLAIDYNTNILYFSYTTKDSSDVFAVAYFNLKTNEFGKISGVNGGFANGVDEKSHSVYFGGSDGIYKLVADSTRAINLNVTDQNVWQMFFKDGLYFTTYPREEAFVYKNNEVSMVVELKDTKAMLIGVDNSNNYVFSNSSGLYYYTKQDGKTAYLGDYVLNGITSDIKGKIFFSTPTGIFSIDEKTKEVKELATIIGIYGVAVESDGSIIYASHNSVIRLKSNGMECF